MGAAVLEVASQLAVAGIPEPRREARLLVALALGVEPTAVLGYPERMIDAAARSRVAAFAARRAAGEPLSRIRGTREFWGLEFALSPATLDPRPDSETIVETALAHVGDRGAGLRILDFGTGTGCLLLALLSELRSSRGLGIDLLPAAAATARQNAAALGFAGRADFIVGDWAQPIRGEWDVIVANPPYIPSADLAGLDAGVRSFDPAGALDGGVDGLASYRELAPALARLMAPTGLAFLEIGAGQAGDVARLMEAAGLAVVTSSCDLSGITRCLVVKRVPEKLGSA